MRFLDVCIVSNRSASSSTLCHVQGLLRKGRPCLDRVLRLAASLILHKNRTSQICNIKSLARSLCNIPTIPRYQESVGISFSTLHCLACFPSSGAVKSQPPWPGDQFHPHGEQATLLPGAKPRINRVVQLQIHPSTPSRGRTAKHGVLPDKAEPLRKVATWHVPSIEAHLRW